MPSVLSQLSVLAEELTDAYTEACTRVANAEADYRRAWDMAYIETDPSLSNAARERVADQVSRDEYLAFKAAEWSEKSALQAVKTTLARLSAAQSHQRFVRDQT